MLLSRLSHKVCRLLSSAVPLRKFTNVTRKGKKSNQCEMVRADTERT